MGLKANIACVTTICLAATGAYAADPYSKGGGLKDVPYAEIAWNWQGFYAGGATGYVSGTSSNDVSANGNDEHGWANNDPDGFIIGGTIGYNHIIAPNWLLGAEADFSWMDVQGDQGKRIYDGHYWTGGWDALFTLRGRLGYTFGQTLLYGTGGYAAIHTNETISGNATSESNYGTDWRSGWVIGAGVEHKFTDRISGKIEYLHAEFERKSGYTGFPGNMDGQMYKMDADLDLIRVGLNYKFY
jgi:outer membrane immunogenic protein